MRFEPLKGCGHENTINIDINEHILRYAIIDDDVVAERFTYSLRRVDQVVHLRPQAYNRTIGQMRDNVALEKQLQTLGDLKLDEMVVSDDAMKNYTRIIDMSSASALDNIGASIYSIATTDGQMVADPKFIREWLLVLPTDEAEGLTDKINELTKWFQSYSEIEYKCAACEADQTFRLELDANRLFGRAGGSLPPKKPSPKSKSGARKRRIR